MLSLSRTLLLSLHYLYPPDLYFLTFWALAVEGVDLVDTLAIVETRLAGTLICVHVAEHTLVS